MGEEEVAEVVVAEAVGVFEVVDEVTAVVEEGVHRLDISLLFPAETGYQAGFGMDRNQVCGAIPAPNCYRRGKTSETVCLEVDLLGLRPHNQRQQWTRNNLLLQVSISQKLRSLPLQNLRCFFQTPVNRQILLWR